MRTRSRAQLVDGRRLGARTHACTDVRRTRQVPLFRGHFGECSLCRHVCNESNSQGFHRIDGCHGVLEMETHRRAHLGSSASQKELKDVAQNKIIKLLSIRKEGNTQKWHYRSNETPPPASFSFFLSSHMIKLSPSPHSRGGLRFKPSSASYSWASPPSPLLRFPSCCCCSWLLLRCSCYYS